MTTKGTVARFIFCSIAGSGALACVSVEVSKSVAHGEPSHRALKAVRW